MKVNISAHVIFLTIALWFSNGLAVQADQMDASEELFDSNELLSEGQDKASEVESFVTNIGNEIITILVQRSQPLASRKVAFRAILDRDFDMPSIGKFVISRYWRGMSNDQQQDYINLFVNAVVESYAAQFDNYNNEKLEVLNSRNTGDSGFLVNSTIIRPGKGQPLKVEWKIFKTPKGMKVLDIVVDGISMSISLRSEYSAVVNSHGGVEGLLDYLREKSSDKPKASEPAAE
jgi:phospholipid transport system substrate-binding protein